MIHISASWTRCLLASAFLALGSLPATATAARVADLYAAPLDAEAGESAARAYSAALAQVLIKVSGSSAAAHPDIVAGFGDAERLVQQYRRDASGRQWVQFDPAAVRRGLQAAALPVWGEDRPLTLVWLRWDVDTDVSDEGLVIRSPTSARTAAMQRDLIMAAQRRGVPLLLPVGDVFDQQLSDVPLSAAEAGEFLRQASQRYPADFLLVGDAHLQPAGEARVQWTLWAAGESEGWQGEVADGPEGLADRLARRLSASGRDRSQVVLEVGGVRDFDQYGALLAYLRGLDLVEGLAIRRLSGDVMQIELQLQSAPARFQQVLALGHMLEPDALGDSRELLQYRLVANP